MALGGGTFTAQNKILPGSYINFVSASRASAALSDRGIAAIPITGDWGELGLIEVAAGDFQKNTMKLFGYDYAAPQLKGLRDLYRNIRLAYIFRLGAGGTKASNTWATAKYPGTRGNALMTAIAANVDDPALFDVSTYLGDALVDMQTVAAVGDLIANDYVQWGATALALEAGEPMTGGVNPTVTNGDYQSFLDAAESVSFNAIGCPSVDPTIKGLFAAFTRRMRDDMGVKFQCVVHDLDADYEGVVNVMNTVNDGVGYEAIYWVTGVIAGTPVNRSALNKQYDGEYEINTAYTQTQLEAAIKGGKFAFHKVMNAGIRVLDDINSLVTTTVEKSDDFKQNQTIRVLDQIGNDIAYLFNTKYLGVIPNDPDGRVSLWVDIVQHHTALQTNRAIQNFSGDDLTVEQGETRRAVVVNDGVTPVNAMRQLYMTVVVQ